MSLDVILYNVTKSACEHCGAEEEILTVFMSNITHNLTTMASRAGIYNVVWHPENMNIDKACEIIPILQDGIKMLEANPEYFKQFEPKNKWGTYDNFVPWLKRYLAACIANPEATVETYT